MNKRKKAKSLLPVLPAALSLLLAFLCITLAESTEASGAEPDRKLVRVGFPIQEKIAEKNEDGTYLGYTVDYLNELIKYTDWDIEYVEAEGDINTQINTLSDLLDNGQIDMLGMMYTSEYLQELYLYPTCSYGSTYTALTVAQASTQWQSDDYQSWNGMRIAAYPGLERRMEQLAQFAKICGFTYETVDYETMDEVLDAVRTGEADACLQVDISIPNDLRAIARFNPSPYYFALNKERNDLLEELNSAMAALQEAHPSLQSELYKHYFLHHKENFILSEDDRAWFDSLEPLRVLYFTGNTPIQDEMDSKPTGVAASFIQAFSEATGLKTEPVFVSSYDECIQQMESGSIDLIAAMPSTSILYSESQSKLSLPYFEGSAVWVTKGNSEPDHDMRQFISASVEEELNSLKYHQGKAALLDAYCVSYYMKKNVIYDELHVEWADRETIPYSVGILPSVDTRLVTILNGFINSLSEQDKQNMLYNNSRGPVHYTFLEKMEVFKWQIAILVAGLLVMVFVLSRARRNRVLRENAAELEHLHQFSLMINECIIKYNVQQDRLIMQNNEVVFHDRETLQPFLYDDSGIDIQNDNEQRFVERLREMLRNQLTTSELELYQDGMPRWFRINLAYIDNEYTIGRLSDINEEVRQREFLEHEASHDALTGMMNRTTLHQHINEHLLHHQKGVFLLLDLDNFKKVNDMMGHHEGDQVLQNFASFLGSAFRAEDYKARLGGDEFVVFLPVQLPEETLQAKLSRFLENVSKQVFADYSACELSVSIGASYVSERLYSFDALYREADSAMYVAKYGGKNAYFIGDGTTCLNIKCVGCRDSCKKRDYLMEHGYTDPSMWDVSSDNL